MRISKRYLLGPAAVAVIVAGAALGAAHLRGHGGPQPAAQQAQPLAPPPAAQNSTDKQISELQARLSQKASDPSLLAQLGVAYLQKVRETSDPAYYGKAESVFQQALAIAPDNGDALYGMGTLALARHQFRDALDWGERAITVNPDRAVNYGIIGDAQIELGRYDEAVATIQQMVNTRPDLSSYSRVSYVRELYGNVDGAIDAMQKAIAAGGPYSENTSYLRVQLGTLYFNNGRAAGAEREYQDALHFSPDYGPALAGLGYLRAAAGDDPDAIDLFTRASQVYPLPEYFIALGDLEGRDAQPDAAKQQYDLVQVMEKLFIAGGVDLDVETSIFLADHHLPGALDLAREGYQHRPSIQGADALAWALYTSGQPQEAEAYATEALRLGTRDALKLYHAGMIAQALGKTDDARSYLSRALALNPTFSILHSAEAREALAALGGAPAGAVARSQP